MSFVDKLLGQKKRRNTSEYIELDLEEHEGELKSKEAEKILHIAEPESREGLMDIKDLIYEGDVVIVELSRWSKKDERLIDELRKASEEIGGDIVQVGKDKVIIVPNGMKINREKLRD